MKLRRIITVAAVTVTVAAGIVGRGMADAATSATNGGRPVASITNVRRVNLHTAYERAAAHVKTGPMSGIVRPRGYKGGTKSLPKSLPKSSAKSSASPASPAATSGTTGTSAAVPGASTCAEPNCNLTYYGGLVQHSPKIYVVFWGPRWTSDAGSQASANYLLNLYRGLGTTQDNWSRITSQYSDGTGTPAFTGSVFAGAVNDTSTPPAKVSDTDIGAEATAEASSLGISNVADAQVVVATQTGTCLVVGNYGFAGDSASCLSSANAQAAYCAWHSDTAYSGADLSFTSLPYQLDAGVSCGQDFINSGSAGTYDGFSIVGGHEYAEAITDPEPSLQYGWVDLSDNVSGGEIADKCAWGGQLWGSNDPDGNITLPTGTFAMQSLWSNAVGGCVMFQPGTAPPRTVGPRTWQASSPRCWDTCSPASWPVAKP